MKAKLAANEFDVDMGRKIYTMRRFRGLSQEKLAEEIGVSFQQLQKYEKGVNRIALERLLKLAEALKVDIDEFISSEPNTLGMFINSNDEEIVHLVSYWERIKDQNVKREIFKFIKSLADNC